MRMSRDCNGAVFGNILFTLSRLLYPRAESNRNRQNRNLKFYPLNYGGNEVAKIRIFWLNCYVFTDIS